MYGLALLLSRLETSPPGPDLSIWSHSASLSSCWICSSWSCSDAACTSAQLSLSWRAANKQCRPWLAAWLGWPPQGRLVGSGRAKR